jgi:hypothetical protein
VGISEQAKPFGIKLETLADRFMTSNRPYHFQLSSGRIGSGREIPLSEFIAVKPPLEFRFPEAALLY